MMNTLLYTRTTLLINYTWTKFFWKKNNIHDIFIHIHTHTHTQTHTHIFVDSYKRGCTSPWFSQIKIASRNRGPLLGKVFLHGVSLIFINTWQGILMLLWWKRDKGSKKRRPFSQSYWSISPRARIWPGVLAQHPHSVRCSPCWTDLLWPLNMRKYMQLFRAGAGIQEVLNNCSPLLSLHRWDWDSHSLTGEEMMKGPHRNPSIIHQTHSAPSLHAHSLIVHKR